MVRVPVTHPSIESYESVDEILGESRTRFFGAGYRQVNHRLFALQIDDRTAKATARIVYPSSWSTKPDRELRPHLSTIDATVLAAQIVEAYARETFGLDESCMRECWVTQWVAKSGGVPTLELEAVPVSLTLVQTVEEASSLCGYSSKFKVSVGSLNLELTLDHRIVERRRVQREYARDEVCLGEPERRYYGSGYRSTGLRLSDVVLHSSAHARARMKLELATESADEGLSGRYMPYISIVEAIVGTAQLGQALLYRQDDLTRATSGTMWMRRILLSMTRPARLQRELNIDTWVDQSSVLTMNNRPWRTAKLGVMLPSMRGEYTVAYELPHANSRSPA